MVSFQALVTGGGLLLLAAAFLRLAGTNDTGHAYLHAAEYIIAIVMLLAGFGFVGLAAP